MSKPRTAKRRTVLVTGASGGLAGTVVHLLAKDYDLVGVDPRPLKNGLEFPGEFHRIDYRQRKMADIFRTRVFDTLIHLGRMPLQSAEAHVRYNTNVLGTRNLLELARKYSVRNVIVTSTFHVYGAHQHNHFHMTEDDPLRASQTFPELSDAVELDHAATTFLLKHRDIRTVILRPTNIIGPTIRNSFSMALRADFCPFLLGYDPAMQFVHEQDFARALKLTLESDQSGVYNVSGEGVVPFTRAIELAGALAIPVPHFLAYPAVGALAKLGMRFPKHLLDYFRFPTVISDRAFRKDFGYRPEVLTLTALKSIRG